MLTLAQASTILDTALNKGREKNFAPLSVAVLDAGGHLIAFKREDKSGILRFDIAFGKAWGALGMGFGSRTLFERAEKTPMFFTTLAAASGARAAFQSCQTGVTPTGMGGRSPRSSQLSPGPW